jgi:hypothetical protein
MLGLLLVYFIWKHFSELSVEHNKSKWVYGLSGIAIYYLGTFLFGLAIGLTDVFAGTHYVDDNNNIIISIISLPFGILSALGLYKFLENKWENEEFGDSNSLDNELQDTTTEG